MFCCDPENNGICWKEKSNQYFWQTIVRWQLGAWVIFAAIANTIKKACAFFAARASLRWRGTIWNDATTRNIRRILTVLIRGKVSGWRSSRNALMHTWARRRECRFLLKMRVTSKKDQSGDVFKQLLSTLRTCPAWSIALVESTDRNDIAQLVSVRYFDNGVSEDILCLIPLKGTTTAADSCNALL